MQKICRLCKKDMGDVHASRKDCGKFYLKNSCSWKVSKLMTKFKTIRDRVLDPKHNNYSRYKHLSIYDEWLSDHFLFVKWALENGWKLGLWIDRIDNNLGYSPSNCRFVTASQNNRNRTNNTTDWYKKTRRCRLCRITKVFNEFIISRGEVGGITYECKLCRRENDRIRYLKNLRKT